jgi:DNA-directed RNA polymerase subunit RPC12/RpoP
MRSLLSNVGPSTEAGLRATTGWTHLTKKKVDKPKYGTHFSPPKCTDCGISMRIKRRQAHPERGPAYELQTYACVRCGQIRQRDAATPGAA